MFYDSFVFPYSHISEAMENVSTTAGNQEEGKRLKDLEVGVGGRRKEERRNERRKGETTGRNGTRNSKRGF